MPKARFVDKYFAHDIEMNITWDESIDLNGDLKMGKFFFVIIILFFVILLIINNNYFFIEGVFENLPYIYIQKNKTIKNKWFFINNFKEILGKDSKGRYEKILIVYNGYHVSEYNNHMIYIKFDAMTKFNEELKIKVCNVKVLNTEIRDEKSKVNYRIDKHPFFTIFKAFKSFVTDLKSLVMDLNFLNDI